MILNNIEVIDIAVDGKAIAKHENIIILMENVIPGDFVDLEITKKKKSYWEGKVLNIIKRSSYREKPFCEHFGICGGCKWQNMKYELQLFYKQKQVSDAFMRIAKLKMPEISPIIPSESIMYYRNKLEFTFSHAGWLTHEEIQDKNINRKNALGFHIPKRFDKVLDVKHCYLQADPSNSIRLEIKNYAIEHHLSFFDLVKQNGFLRNLIIRTSSLGETMVIVIFFYEDRKLREALLDHIIDKFPAITSLQYVINPKRNDTIFDLDVHLYKGRSFIYESMEKLQFRIGPKSFYQTNSMQVSKMYKIIREFAQLKGDEVVYDLYTGTGTIANFLASQCKKVVGIDYIDTAIEDAKENAIHNNFLNTAFYSGDIKDTLTNDFFEKNGKPDVIITDPPRAGMHEKVVEKLLNVGAEKIIYVSCNPSTQARDLQLLSSDYEAIKIQPIDIFPHTSHVENIVLLKKKHTNK